MEPITLYIITLWDNELIMSYPIVAKNQEEASKVAIRICIEERIEEEMRDQDPTVDFELSFEITCAPDQAGKLFNISLNAQ